SLPWRTDASSSSAASTRHWPRCRSIAPPRRRRRLAPRPLTDGRGKTNTAGRDGQPVAGRSLGSSLRSGSSRVPERQWLFLPIQTKVREFTAKVLLAAVTAERGLGVVITSQRMLRANIQRLPASLIGDYSARLPMVEPFRRYAELGHRVVAWEEEGL